MKLYSCTKCKNLFPLTEEHFFSCQIKRYNKPECTSAGQCKHCALIYQEKYRESLRKKNLTRRNDIPKYIEHGLLYIIGTTPSNPVKIGITAGNTIKKRLVGLQTSHWLELQVFYESPSIPNVNKVEQELHQRFSQYNIRGEWFDIPQEKIKKLVKELQKKFSTP